MLLIVIVCDTVLLLWPQSSTANHLFVIDWKQPWPVVVVVSFTVTAPQLSLAVGGVNVGDAPQVIVSFPPGSPIVGDVRFTTDMV